MADDLFGVFDEDANNDNESVALGAYTLNEKLNETTPKSSYEFNKLEKKSKRKVDQISDFYENNQNNISEDKDNLKSDDEQNPNKRFQQEEFDDWR
jgi:hypothetical protein